MPLSRPRGERGVAAVEFALVVPLLLVVLFGIIDFGFAINRYSIVNTAKPAWAPPRRRSGRR